MKISEQLVMVQTREHSTKSKNKNKNKNHGTYANQTRFLQAAQNELEC